MRRLHVVSKDDQLIEEIQSLIDLLPNWELKVYTNVSKAWIDYLKYDPDLTFVDLDFIPAEESERSRFIHSRTNNPMIIYSGTPGKSSKQAQYAVSMDAVDYLPKPINLNDLLFAISIANGPLDQPPQNLL